MFAVDAGSADQEGRLPAVPATPGHQCGVTDLNDAALSAGE
jgi:hypothetical protein